MSHADTACVRAHTHTTHKHNYAHTYTTHAQHTNSLVNTSLGHKYPPNLIEAHYPCTVCLWELCTTRALCPKNSFSISVIDKWNTIPANIISARLGLGLGLGLGLLYHLFETQTSLNLNSIFCYCFYRHSLILILSTDSYFLSLSFSYLFILF